MRKTLSILLLIVVFMITGCNAKLNTNYIRPVNLKEDEQKLLELVAPREYLLLEYDASDYKAIYVSFEKYEDGKMVGDPIKPGIICDDSLGKGQLYLGIGDKNIHLAIQGKAESDFPIEVDEKYTQSVYTWLDSEVSLKDNNEVIVYFKNYADNSTNGMAGYSIDYYTDENITDCQFCYRIVVSFE